MATVRVRQVLPGTVHEAESCWYETSRWPNWVDTLARVVSVQGDWPRVGASIVWQSTPAGRGRVRERVVAYEVRRGQTVELEDDSIQGHQEVSFIPVDAGVQVELRLKYRIKRRTPLTPLLEWLFVRRPMVLSLTRTLERFGAELEASRGSTLG